jgi:deoxyguanosine kinase
MIIWILSFFVFVNTLVYILYFYFLKNIKPISISIDGNIGSGKSTLIQILQEELKNNDNIIFLQEPVSEWLKVTDGKTNILNNFYCNKKRWSYTFQNFAFITRSHIMLEAIKNNMVYPFQKRKVIITERSTETDKHIFAKMLYDEGNMDKLEYEIYNYWYNKLMNGNNINNNIIYLRTTPKDAFDRINKRGRTEEKKIPIDYIQNVHKYHDNWLVEGTKNCNICYLDGTDDFQNNEKCKKKIVKSITVFINSLESRFNLTS